MAPLKLINLNYGAFRHISEKTDEMSLLNFAISMSSTKSEFRPAQKTRKLIKKIDINIDDAHCVITVQFSEKMDLYWKIYSTEDLPKKGRYDEFQLHNMTVKNRRYKTKTRYIIHSQCQSDIIVCQKILELMFRIYNPDKLNFYISRKTLNITNFLKFKGFNRVDDLTFIIYYPISHQGFDIFWKTIHPKKSICFNSWDYNNTNRENQIAFNHGFLQIFNSIWLTEEEFFKISSKRIKLMGSSMTSEVMNRYIKEWMNGANSQLEVLEIDIKNGNLNVILDGIESKSMEEVKKEHNLEYKKLEFTLEGQKFCDYKDKFDGSNGKHVTRNDGKVATIDLTESSRMYFVVWNEKIPKITDN